MDGHEALTTETAAFAAAGDDGTGALVGRDRTDALARRPPQNLLSVPRLRLHNPEQQAAPLAQRFPFTRQSASKVRCWAPVRVVSSSSRV